MKTTKPALLIAFISMVVISAPCFSQQSRVFNWLPGNEESVRLDPANYHTGITYHASGDGGNMQVDFKAEKPITIFLTPAAAWTDALQRPENIPNLRQLCLREHVVETRYSCFVPPEPMTLVIRDERYNPDAPIFAGLGAVLDPLDKSKIGNAVGVGIASMLSARNSSNRRFASPNDVDVQYYRWECVENCVQPEFQWREQVKEKYELTSFLKLYGGFAPDHDGARVSIKIKSPIPMVVAMVPSQIAGELHTRADSLDSALENNPCQQRAVQSLQFECTFNLSDGPQSLIVVPEAGANVPNHKKAEVEMQAVKCVENCQLIEDKQ
jgi:hypothetical protein